MYNAQLTSPRIVRLRYKDRYVYLESGGEHYGTMTMTADGMVEFDFSNCTVLRIEPLYPDGPAQIDGNDAHLLIGD